MTTTYIQINNLFEFEKLFSHGIIPRTCSLQKQHTVTHQVMPYRHHIHPLFRVPAAEQLSGTAAISAVTKEGAVHSFGSREDLAGPLSLDVQHRRPESVGPSQPRKRLRRCVHGRHRQTPFRSVVRDESAIATLRFHSP